MLVRHVVREALVAGVAELEGYADDEIGEIEAAIADCGGLDSYELDSKQAEWIIAHVEHVLDLAVPLPKPSDLHREQFATLQAPLDLIVEMAEDRSEDVELH